MFSFLLSWPYRPFSSFTLVPTGKSTTFQPSHAHLSNTSSPKFCPLPDSKFDVPYLCPASLTHVFLLIPETPPFHMRSKGIAWGRDQEAGATVPSHSDVFLLILICHYALLSELQGGQNHTKKPSLETTTTRPVLPLG